MDKEVYSTKEFLDYAKKNYVLVKVDFPKKKQQSEALKRANQQLMDKHNVEFFPTALIMNGDGKVLGKEVGYKDRKSMITTLEKYRKQNL